MFLRIRKYFKNKYYEQTEGPNEIASILYLGRLVYERLMPNSKKT